MYLVTLPGYPPFLTMIFDPENHWQQGMIVYKLHYTNLVSYTTDGKNWMSVMLDNL